MNNVDQTQNVVSIRAFKTVRECQKFFKGYQSKINRMDKAELLVELERYRGEADRYPSHLLTIVKGEILMQTLSAKALSTDLREYANKEQSRLKQEIALRVRTIPSIINRRRR